MRSGSLTISPRAQFTIRTPGFILAIDSELIMPRVSGVTGMWTVMKSDER